MTKPVHSRHKTFLRQWREHRNLTLVQVAEEVGLSHGQLSRIERGQSPYNQDLLEALGNIYHCDVPDLLLRDPAETTPIWSIWDQAAPGERDQIARIAEAVIGFRAKTEEHEH